MFNIKRVDPRLLSRSNVVNHSGPRAGWIQLFNRLDRGVEVTLIPQIDQQLICVADDYLFSQSGAGLGQIHTSTKLVFGNRSAVGWTKLKSNVSQFVPAAE